MAQQLSETAFVPTSQSNRRFALDFAGSAFVIDLLRTAEQAMGRSIELVAYDGERVTMLGSRRDEPLRPRRPSPAETKLMDAALERETQLWASRRLEAMSALDSSAAPVLDPDGELVGAVSCPEELTETELLQLDGFARLFAHYLTVEPGQVTSTPVGFGTAVLDGLRDLVVVLNPDMSVRWCNGAVGLQLGLTPEDLVGRNMAELIHPDDVEAALDAVVRLQQGHTTYRVSLRVQHGRGTYQPMVVLGLDRTIDPVLNGFVVSLRSDERRHDVERELDRNRKVSAAILRHLSDAVIAVDPSGAVRLINDAARKLFEVDPELPAAALHRSHLSLHRRDLSPLPDKDHPLRTAGPSSTAVAELCIVRAHDTRFVTVQSRHVVDGDEDLGLVITIQDNTDELAADAELKSMALADQLTGLPNRRRLEIELQRLADAPGRGFVVGCFIDLDGFKSVNDLHGHRTGDELLRIAGSRLSAQLRDADLLARQGGDEFVALLRNIERVDKAVVTAERLRTALSAPYDIDGTIFHLTASVGVLAEPADQLECDTFLQRADIALYAAKERGRNRVEVFDAELERAVSAAQANREMIRAALEDDRLAVRFQPIVDTDDESIVGVEALVRCVLPDGKVVGPGRFLDDLVGSSLLVDLDHRAFEHSCAAARRIRELVGHPLAVACNFSAATLTRPDVVERVTTTTKRFGIEPSQVCIEITESGAFDTDKSNVGTLRALRERGFEIALDDFGTGYSSLSHLRELPLSVLKLDRSFVPKLSAANAERAIAAAIVQLSTELGFHVVAEGVENEAELAAVRGLGFRIVQGWHFYRDVDIETLLELLGEEMPVLAATGPRRRSRNRP